jgi:hypothetical protein
MWGTLDAGERDARRALLYLLAEGAIADASALAASLGCSASQGAHLLEALVAKGYVVRGGVDGILAAYPLSVRPTRHRVTLEGGRAVYALCAVDALGVSPLFGVDTVIETHCPHCERAIRLDVRSGDVQGAVPSTAVLWYSMADLLEKRIEGLDLSAEH